mmetsp:Transcript_36580/g.75032  ORF Transcript_36580/g.75032 Transcript_36580/m.75032 type:complete len:217 (-) Transcript_36580:1008-1658(-)
MLDRLVVGAVPQSVAQVFENALSVVSVDQTKSVQRTSLCVWAGGNPCLRQVLLHDVEGGVDAALVHHAHTCRRGELGPVRRPLQPLEVLGDESVNRRSAVHHCVSKHRRLVRHTVTHLQRPLDVVQDQHVRLVVAIQELQIDPDRRLTAQNLAQFLHARSQLLLLVCRLRRSGLLRSRLLHLRVAITSIGSRKHVLCHRISFRRLLVHGRRERCAH